MEFIIIDPFAEEPSGLANLFQHLNSYLGIPLLLRKHRNFTIGDIVAEGEKVAFYFTFSGTYKDKSKGNPPTSKSFTMMEAYFSRFEDGKTVEFRNFQAQRQDE